MDLSDVSQMESPILLGIVNEKLRLECNSFHHLATKYELDVAQIFSKLNGMGYQYDPLTNQFKPL
jgi:CRISPR/Cas system endoribonuclease Cas6 (RAMP superfamily)